MSVASRMFYLGLMSMMEASTPMNLLWAAHPGPWERKGRIWRMIYDDAKKEDDWREAIKENERRKR